MNTYTRMPNGDLLTPDNKYLSKSSEGRDTRAGRLWAEALEDIAKGATVVDSQPEVPEYVQKRMAEYPSVEEQLDYIYHNGIEKWKTDVIKPVKDKWPKR